MNFGVAFERLIGHEGGYVNDPNDPGGETKWGISKRSYPDLDIKSLTRDDARAIYSRDFWLRGHMAALPFAVAFQCFDAAVNHGIRAAHRMLQRAVKVNDDGIIGVQTMTAIKAHNATDLVMLFLAERLEFWVQCKGWPHFGAGWVNRAAQNLRYGAEDS